MRSRATGRIVGLFVNTTEIKFEILRLVREYSRRVHTAQRPAYEEGPDRNFVPGETVVPYAGRVFTEEREQLLAEGFDGGHILVLLAIRSLGNSDSTHAFTTTLAKAVGIPYSAVGHLLPCPGGPSCPRVHFVQRFPKDLAHALAPSNPPRNRRADAVCCPPTGGTCLPNARA